jgi:hypothetical protein
MDTPWGGMRPSSTLYWAEQLGQEICTGASQGADDDVGRITEHSQKTSSG